MDLIWFRNESVTDMCEEWKMMWMSVLHFWKKKQIFSYPIFFFFFRNVIGRVHLLHSLFFSGYLSSFPSLIDWINNLSLLCITVELVLVTRTGRRQDKQLVFPVTISAVSSRFAAYPVRRGRDEEQKEKVLTVLSPLNANQIGVDGERV